MFLISLYFQFIYTQFKQSITSFAVFRSCVLDPTFTGPGIAAFFDCWCFWILGSWGIFKPFISFSFFVLFSPFYIYHSFFNITGTAAIPFVAQPRQSQAFDYSTKVSTLPFSFFLYQSVLIHTFIPPLHTSIQSINHIHNTHNITVTYTIHTHTKHAYPFYPPLQLIRDILSMSLSYGLISSSYFSYLSHSLSASQMYLLYGTTTDLAHPDSFFR